MLTKIDSILISLFEKNILSLFSVEQKIVLV